MTEQLHAIRAIWSEDTASFDGNHVKFEGVQAFPKPIQKPGPEVLIGGDSDGTRQRVLEAGDGWMPTHDRSGPDLESNIVSLLAAGRDSGHPTSVSVSNVPPDPTVLEGYAALGVSRLVFAVPTEERAALDTALQERSAAMKAADLG